MKNKNNTAVLSECSKITIGKGVNTNIPINLYSEHKNILLSGSTGSGKSTLLRLVVKRFKEKYPTGAIFFIERSGEHKNFAKELGLDVVTINKDFKKFNNQTMFILENLMLKDGADTYDVDARVVFLKETLNKILDRIQKMPSNKPKLILTDEIEFYSINPPICDAIKKFIDINENNNMIFLATVYHIDNIDDDLRKSFQTKINTKYGYMGGDEKQVQRFCILSTDDTETKFLLEQ